MSARTRAPGRGGKAAVVAGNEEEAGVSDPFAFDGSQDELLGQVVEAGAAPEAVNQALLQAGAAAPGPSPRVVSPTAGPGTALRETPGRADPDPSAGRHKRSSQSGDVDMEPDGGEDPFCFEASMDAKRFENVPPDLPAATRVAAAVRELPICAGGEWL